MRYALLGNCDVIDRECITDGPLEFGNSLVEIGPRLQFPCSGGSKFGLTLEYQIESGCTAAELPLFAGIKLLGCNSGIGGRSKAGFRGPKGLKCIPDLGFDDLFSLRTGISDTVTLDNRLALICLCDPVAPGKRNIHPDTI